MSDEHLYQELETTLNYKFDNLFKLDIALRHSSYVNEQPGGDIEDNERLEFLGDAVLNLVIGDILMTQFPELKEGDLSRMRSGLVNETQLAAIARSINLGPCIKLGKGEEMTNGREKNSILSDVLEAVIAAVYLDGGFDSAFKVVKMLFTENLSQPETTVIQSDYKSRLQELSQTRYKIMPRYKVVEESGPDHDKTFKVKLTLNQTTVHGTGKSKKAAEQDAAGKALTELDNLTD